MNFYYYTTYHSNIQALEKIFIYFSKIISSLWLQHSMYSSLLSHRVVGKNKNRAVNALFTSNADFFF